MDMKIFIEIVFSVMKYSRARGHDEILVNDQCMLDIM